MKLEASTRLMAETYKDYISRLEQQLSKVPNGQGAFGRVYNHPELPDVVVKVFCDLAYSKFLEFCEDNQGNVWLPKILALERLQLDFRKDTFAVFLERLKPASSAKISQFFKPFSQFTTIHGATRMLRAGWDFVATHDDDAQLRVVAKFLSQNYASLDLRDPNFMVRGQQLVFNDPISY